MRPPELIAITEILDKTTRDVMRLLPQKTEDEVYIAITEKYSVPKQYPSRHEGQSQEDKQLRRFSKLPSLNNKAQKPELNLRLSQSYQNEILQTK